MRNKKLWISLGIAVLAGLFVFFAGTWLLSAYYLKQGTTEFIKGDFIKARPLFGRSLKYNPRNSESHFYLGKIALGKTTDTPGVDLLYPSADYADAANYFEKAIAFGLERKNQNFYFAALNDIAFSYQMLREYEKATQNFLLLIEKNPEQSFVARYFVAYNYIERFNKPQEALNLLLPIVGRIVPARNAVHEANLYRIYVMLARLSAYFNNATDYEKYARLAVENTGQNRDLDAALAHALFAFAAGAKKDFTAMDKEIAKADEIFGSSDTFACGKAASYFLGGDSKKAVAAALLIKRTEDYAYSVCLAILGDASLALKNLADAKKYYKEYILLTDTLKDKNIFVIRNRQRFAEELKKLGQQ